MTPGKTPLATADVDQTVEVCGIRFPNPVLTAAGPPVRDAAAILACAAGGAGGLVAKTFSRTAAVVPTPNMAEISHGFLNAERWSELPPEQWLEEELPRVRAAAAGLPLIVSLGYTAPPLKFVYRGLGEIAVAIGFGPLMLLGAFVVQTGGALAWEPFVASIPIALLVALILYVNEIPDRRGDARVGKRTLPVRFSETTVITGYNVAAAVAYIVLVAGVVAGFLPIPALAMLLTIPMARRVSRGLAPNYDNPYGLMAIMGVNVQLHLRAGLILLAAYAVVLVVGAVAPSVSLFLG